MKKATIADVAELAGVSKATVSRFLKQENVREEIAERIRAAIQETGYVARGSKANKTNEKTTGAKGRKIKNKCKSKTEELPLRYAGEGYHFAAYQKYYTGIKGCTQRTKYYVFHLHNGWSGGA